MLAAASMMLAACSEKENVNSSDATVGFQSTTVEYKESDGMIKLPIKIDGERNGNIKIKVEATDGTAKSEEHYILTSGDINVPATVEGTIDLEIRLIDDGQTENDDREFKLTITEVNGATLGANKTVTVVVKDVDKNPYYKLFGTYTADAYDVEGNPCPFTVTIDNDGDTDEQYLYATGLPTDFYQFDTKWILAYSPDGNLTFEYGYWDGLYNFGSFVGVVTTMPYFQNESTGKWAAAESASATYNDTFDTITFEDGMGMCTAVFAYDEASRNVTDYMGYYDGPVVVKSFKRVAAE